MDGNLSFIAGIIIAAAIIMLERLVMLLVAKKKLCIFITRINRCIKSAVDHGVESGYYYGAAFGYITSLYWYHLLSKHDTDFLYNLIYDSMEKRCEIDVDVIKGVKK